MNNPLHILQPLYLVWALLLLLCPTPFVRGQAARFDNASNTLRVSSDFPGGSAKVLSLDLTNSMIRITPAGDPDRGWPCWWYLRLDGVDTNQVLVLEVVGNEARVQGNNPGQNPKLNANWSLPTRAAVSMDGRSWENTAPGVRQGKQMTYRVKSPARTLWLAWGPPFTLQDANELIAKAAKLNPSAKPFELARTRAGRPVPGLRVSQPGTAERDRFGIWVQARQHAWECGSSWVICGFTEWLVSDDPVARSLREKADITIIPIMDVDSVETGNGGKQQRPHDQNQDWGAAPHFPEVQAGMSQVSALAKAGRLDVFLDLHNPGAGEQGVFIYIPPRPLLDEIRLANQTAFTNLMRTKITGPIPFTGRVGPCGETYDPAVDKSVDAWAANEGGSHVVSLTIETAWNNPASTPAGYRQVGEQIGRTIEAYVRGSPLRSRLRK
jgi:hypothetical protein